ncbi:MAG: hypothetical protein R3D25_03370 [Geminicoccaceae bacterium]
MRLEGGAVHLFVKREVAFRNYPTLRPGTRATVVTPPDGAYLHTFFDVPPISPSGRYLAVTRLPFQHRGPYPGDTAEVCVIDLVERTIETVHHTHGWALQLGANLHWHPGRDDLLYCNDRIDGRGLGVAIDLPRRRARLPLGRGLRALPARAATPRPGPRPHQHDPGRWPAASTDPLLGRRRRPASPHPGGSGAPSSRAGAATCSPRWPTCSPLTPSAPASPPAGIPSSTPRSTAPATASSRVVRSTGADAPEKVRAMILTLDAAGGAVRLALPHQLWDRGGHHPSWTPDDHTILMNLVPPGGNEMRFVRFGHDGAGLAELAGGFRGSGHPSRPEQAAAADRRLSQRGLRRRQWPRAPIRLIDLAAGEGDPAHAGR